MDKNRKLTRDERIARALAKKNTPNILKQDYLRKNKKVLTEKIKRVRNNKLLRNARPKKAYAKLEDLKSNLLLEIPSISDQASIQYPTPDWFTKKDKAAVSIIIPLFKSTSVLKDLVESWDLSESLNVEVIFVDDCCPASSKNHLINEWSNRRSELKKPIGKIIYNSANYGFGSSCNIGVQHSTGNYLIFLNADVLVTPGWIKPILQLLVKPEVGIVGNMQIKHGGEHHGTIDSAGSEWNWDHMMFLHIGRNSYNHHTLKSPFKLDNAPADLFEVQEREMVTGACLAMRRNVFEEIGGFNPNYRIAYWEDSEICMAVKEKGYKILYQPNSKIYHVVSHSKSGSHKFAEHNINFFKNKWISSGRIDNLVKSPRKTPLNKVKSIVIKRSAADGDVLVAAAIAPALKKKYPEANIIFNTPRNKVLLNNPYISRVVTSDKLSERSYDLYYNLDMAYEFRPKTNMLQAYADVVGVPISDCKLFIHKEFYPDLPEKYVVIHSTNNSWVGRNWSCQKFNIVSKYLMDKGIFVVNIGSFSDNEIISNLNLVRKTSVHQLAYVISKSMFFIGVDSFPMHIAEALEIPGVAFFGSVNPKNVLTGTSIKPIVAEGLSCLGCHHNKTGSVCTNICEAKTIDCVNKVSVDMMLEHTKHLWT